MPFLVTDETVAYSSLEPTDIGKWAVLVQGCYHLFTSYGEALQASGVIYGRE